MRLKDVAVVPSNAAKSVFFVAAVVVSINRPVTAAWSTPDRKGARGWLAADEIASMVSRVARAPFTARDEGYAAAVRCLPKGAGGKAAASI
jgi:hypothetical protein